MQGDEKSVGSQFATTAYVDEKAKELRDLIVERETNRVRAAATLIGELHTYATKGIPVSAAAIKGFFFAMLAPRILLIVGSLIGGAVLLLQTVLIWQQNRLLQRQTDVVEAAYFTLFDISSEFSEKGLRFKVKNVGTAVAEIHGIKCLLNGSFPDIATIGSVFGVGHVSHRCNSASGGVLSPGESVEILVVAIREDVDQIDLDKVYAAFSEAFETIEIEVNYQGRLDKEPKVRTYASRPAPVPASES